MSEMSFKVDKEFASFWPPSLKDEDFEQSVVAGLRDLITVWKEENILLDGHRRVQILIEHKIPIPTDKVHILSFPSRAHAMLWILENQTERRGTVATFLACANVMKPEMLALFDQMAKAAESEAGKKGGRGHKKVPPSGGDLLEACSDRYTVMARRARVSYNSVSRVAYIKKHDPKEYARLEKQARTDPEAIISILTAWQNVKSLEHSKVLDRKASTIIKTQRNVEAFSAAVEKTKASPAIQRKVAAVVAADEGRGKHIKAVVGGEDEEKGKKTRFVGDLSARTETIKSLIIKEELEEQLGPRALRSPKTAEEQMFEKFEPTIEAIFQQSSALSGRIERFISDLKREKVENLGGIKIKLGQHDLGRLVGQIVGLFGFFGMSPKGGKECPKQLNK